ncbi:peptidoglycan DD-metalloendopeptidase family protein [Lysobacter firmicutimachus]|uniref:Peptidoglycan DD-metalloendopeptidase family protein n=1 Tax=Lysobacter firmicutimachus TaxID=1792846 RepID=A0AAU8MXP3_9GAMM
MANNEYLDRCDSRRDSAASRAGAAAGTLPRPRRRNARRRRYRADVSARAGALGRRRSARPRRARRYPPIEVAKAPPPQVGGLGWPVSGALLAGFGGTMPDGRSSEGLLIGAPAGATVKAVGDGTVVYSEWMTGYGLLLIVDHGKAT